MHEARHGSEQHMSRVLAPDGAENNSVKVALHGKAQGTQREKKEWIKSECRGE